MRKFIKGSGEYHSINYIEPLLICALKLLPHWVYNFLPCHVEALRQGASCLLRVPNCKCVLVFISHCWRCRVLFWLDDITWHQSTRASRIISFHRANASLKLINFTIGDSELHSLCGEARKYCPKAQRLGVLWSSSYCWCWLSFFLVVVMWQTLEKSSLIPHVEAWLCKYA